MVALPGVQRARTASSSDSTWMPMEDAPASKRSAWPWVAAVVGALVVLGNVSDGTNQDGFTETTMAQDAGDNPDGMSAEDATGWIVEISEDALAPPLAPVAPTLGAVALGLVGWSFAVDLVWLARVPR